VAPFTRYAHRPQTMTDHARHLAMALGVTLLLGRRIALVRAGIACWNEKSGARNISIMRQ
jgi:hypothetical protein